EHKAQITPGDLVLGLRLARGRPPFRLAAPLGRGLQLHREMVRDLVEPAGQGMAAADVPGLARPNEERRLESVLGLRVVVEHAPAHAQNERAVPLDEAAKGGAVARSDKMLDQFRIEPAGVSRGRNLAKKANRLTQWSGFHHRKSQADTNREKTGF